ncbi:hypothetical protein ASD39_06585 [Sphingomonas sp. Root50]|nr:MULTISPECIES: hypothetical protein [unclassified Sphingomonas]KQX23480.1 hypothetical protein ASD17_04065 [Sphingomonas sp. Root1294]KQY68330.1 hypothetical protein ASD39_06585 [Sphingomonas sp. Root50]KRB91231.1 hypothetical protein ASE22_13390 [Sphingomonas sp. Root720]
MLLAHRKGLHADVWHRAVTMGIVDTAPVRPEMQPMIGALDGIADPLAQTERRKAVRAAVHHRPRLPLDIAIQRQLAAKDLARKDGVSGYLVAPGDRIPCVLKEHPLSPPLFANDVSGAAAATPPGHQKR